MLELRPGHGIEQCARQVLRAAIAGRPKMDGLGLAFGQSDQLTRVVGLDLWVDHQDVGRLHQFGNRGKGLDRIVGQLAIDRLAQHVGGGGHQQGVAIRGRFRHMVSPDGGACPLTVLHHHLLPQTGGQTDRGQSSHDVGEPAGSGRHDDADRTAGEPLSPDPGAHGQARRTAP